MVNKNTERIAKNTLVLYVRMLFLMLIGLFTSREILAALGVEDYGIYNVVGGFVSMFSLVSSALTSSCTRFINYEMGAGNPQRLRTVFSTTVTIQYCLTIIIAILCETIGLWYVNNKMVLPPERLYAANWCFQLSVLSFCLNLIQVPYNAAIVAHEDMKTFAYVSILEGVAKLAICFLIMCSPFDRLIFYAILLFIVSLIIRIIYQVYCRRHYAECKYYFVLNRSFLKQIFNYTGWHLIGNGSAILRYQGVNVVLNLFFGPVLNAAKGVGSQVQSLVTRFAGNFMIALNPQITQSYAKKDYQYMFNLVYRGSRFSFYILFLLGLPVVVNADYLVHLWLKEVPDYAVAFAQLGLINAMLQSMSNTLITAQNATGQVRNYQLIVGGLQLLILPLSYLVLYLGFSPLSVLWVSIIMDVVLLLARLYMLPFTLKDFKPTDYFKKVVFKCLVITFLSAIIPFLLKEMMPDNLCTTIMNVLVCILISSLCVYYIGCSCQERMQVNGYINKFKNKVFHRHHD